MGVWKISVQKASLCVESGMSFKKPDGNFDDDPIVDLNCVSTSSVSLMVQARVRGRGVRVS